MNEPKRRGRPPKDASAQIGAMQAEVINTWAASQAQAYAKRVWDGQSTDVPRKVRLERVALALQGQGLSMEGVSL